ncbi:HAD family hydrolase [Paludibacterium yongneupense]|uniref:HAD family hydrolase n=1 Tax=Paludibacterium yongneupense TaxID=400061 RepID=UPI000406B7EB|nr:HAD family hydrolase [Paludibacterium yongneupense]
MALAIFDLDDTLIDGDSASLWLRFLVREGHAPADMLPREAAMMDAYRAGRLDMESYMDFTLHPLRGRLVDEVAGWVRQYVASEVAPLVFPAARAALEDYRVQGRRRLVISATGEHLVGPIASHLGVADFLAIELGQSAGRYDGTTVGVLTYQHGKTIRLASWLEQNGESLQDSHGYSDSVNDVPLLDAVASGFVVNPDARLSAVAAERGWPRLDWQR